MSREPQDDASANCDNEPQSNVYDLHHKAAPMATLLLQVPSWIRSALPPRDDDRGAAVVEYALLLTFIMAVLLISVTVIGDTTSNGLDDAGSSGFIGP